MPSKASPKWFGWFVVRAAVSALCLGIIGYKLWQMDGPAVLRDVWHTGSLGLLTLAVLLLFPNLWLESVKWQVGSASIKKISLKDAWYATLKGISLGFPLTGTVGDYAGKLSLYERRQAPRLLPLLILHSYSQYLVSILLGGIGFLFWNEYTHLIPVPAEAWAGIGIIGLLLLGSYVFYGRVGMALANQILNMPRFAALFGKAAPKAGAFFWLSVARYAVFHLQFLFVLKGLGADQPWYLLAAGISVIYAAKTAVPLISFAGFVGLREVLALRILAPLGVEAFPILTGALLIWVINLVLPGLVGAVVGRRG